MGTPNSAERTAITLGSLIIGSFGFGPILGDSIGGNPLARGLVAAAHRNAAARRRMGEDAMNKQVKIERPAPGGNPRMGWA